MANLPNLPGLTFTDPTVTKYHVPHNYDVINGYRVLRTNLIGIGEKEVDVHSCLYDNSCKPIRYDASLTYGRSKGCPLPQFVPHFIALDKKCLTFIAYFKQTLCISEYEHYRVRVVKIIYFLEDDTIFVMEPVVPNCGFQQGRLIRRSKISKTNFDYWHWKDFNIGTGVTLNGLSFHIVDCDEFTKRYMAAQGIVLRPTEDIPPDPYIQNRQLNAQMRSKIVRKDDKMPLFLEYSDKILKFDALWDDSDSEYGDKKECTIYFHLVDNTISVKLLPKPCIGCDLGPLLIKRVKIPKLLFAYPVLRPVHLEPSAEDVMDYYAPKDFIVGQTVHILGRKLLLLDCDKFTRDYFQSMLKITQGPSVKMPKEEQKYSRRLEKARPKGSEISKIVNANKYLRYALKMVAVHPEDAIREFVLLYSLAHGTIQIFETALRNSGIMGGKFLRNTLLEKPGSELPNPEYYTIADFQIGAMIYVNGFSFIVTNADLNVYHYIEANSEKFSEELLTNMKNHMFREGNLPAVLQDQDERKIKIPTMDDIQVPKIEKEVCMDRIEANLRDVKERFRNKGNNAKYVHFEDKIPRRKD